MKFCWFVDFVFQRKRTIKKKEKKHGG